MYKDLADTELGAGDWPFALHDALSQNEIAFQLSERLGLPSPVTGPARGADSRRRPSNHRARNPGLANQRFVHTVGPFLPTTIALLRLAPHMPFALTNLAVARLPLAPAKIWLSSYVGLLPRTLFAAYIGNQLQDWRALLDRQRPPWELLLSLALLVLFVYLGRRAARRLENQIDEEPR